MDFSPKCIYELLVLLKASFVSGSIQLPHDLISYL